MLRVQVAIGSTLRPRPRLLTGLLFLRLPKPSLVILNACTFLRTSKHRTLDFASVQPPRSYTQNCLKIVCIEAFQRRLISTYQWLVSGSSALISLRLMAFSKPFLAASFFCSSGVDDTKPSNNANLMHLWDEGCAIDASVHPNIAGNSGLKALTIATVPRFYIEHSTAGSDQKYQKSIPNPHMGSQRISLFYWIFRIQLQDDSPESPVPMHFAQGVVEMDPNSKIALGE